VAAIEDVLGSIGDTRLMAATRTCVVSPRTFFAAVSLTVFVPSIGIGISFCPAAAFNQTSTFQLRLVYQRAVAWF
jgi:hypothetical protein